MTKQLDKLKFSIYRIIEFSASGDLAIIVAAVLFALIIGAAYLF